MEQLTKQQIVLVTLLVSFVTSIATGIVTVALMDQAPPGVTQTINRVVERTIEKVVPSPNQQTAAVVTKETIVVKEDDLVVKAVDQNSKSIVSIYSSYVTGETKIEEFAGNALIVSKDGMMVTDVSILESVIDETGNPLPKTFKAVLLDGSVAAVAPVSGGASDGLVLLKPTLDDKQKIASLTFTPATPASITSFKLGQTVIALGGEHVSVATGIISNLSDKKLGVAGMGDIATSTVSSIVKVGNQIITTDIHGIGKSVGSILVSLSGDVVGIRILAVGSGDNVYLGASAITEQIAKITAPATPVSR